MVGVAVSMGSVNRTANLLNLGQQYLDELNYEQAVICFEEYLEIEPKSVEAYIGLAEAYIGLDEYAKALEVLASGYDITGDTRLQRLSSKIEEQYLTEGKDEDTLEGGTIESHREYYEKMNEEELKNIINEMLILEPRNINEDSVISKMTSKIAFLYDADDFIVQKSILFSKMDEEDVATLEFLILHYDWYDPLEINADDLSRVSVNKSSAVELFDDFYCSGENFSWDNEYLNDAGENVEFSVGDPEPDYILREKVTYENEQYILLEARVYDYWAEDISGEETPLDSIMQILFYKNENSRYGMTALYADIQSPEAKDIVIDVTWDGIIEGNLAALEYDYDIDGTVDIMESPGHYVFNVELPESGSFSLQLFDGEDSVVYNLPLNLLSETNVHVVIMKNNQIIEELDYEDANNLFKYPTGIWGWKIIISNEEVIW